MTMRNLGERWLTIHFKGDSAQPERHILEAINACLELRHHGRFVSRDGRRGSRNSPEQGVRVRLSADHQTETRHVNAPGHRA